MNRNFTTVADNEKWSGDVTEINTGEGKLYVSGFRDIHSGYLLGHKISTSNNNELVYENIQDILTRKDVKVDKLMIQTDRGYQYTSYGFKEILNGITHSMNRPGHCPDNSPIESFWGIFKSECYYNPHMKEAFRTREGAKKAIDDYIEFYNNTRINSKGTTPNQIRNNSLAD